MHATGRPSSRLTNLLVVVGVVLAVAATTLLVPRVEIAFSTRAASRLSATWSATSVASGDRASVRGRVYSRQRAGRAVELWTYLKSGWRRSAWTHTGPNGYYTLVVPTGSYVSRPMQVRVRATRTAAAATSTSRPVTVRPAYTPGGSSRDWAPRVPGQEQRWNPCVPVTYAANDAAAGPGALADLEAAIALVHQATGITFRSRGRTTAFPGNGAQPAGVDILVGYGTQADTGLRLDADMMSTSAVLATRRAHDAQGPVTRIVQAAIVVNSAENDWFTEHAASRMRVRVLMHEIGAVLGLGPVTARYQRMNEAVYPVDTTNWGAGDLAGLNRLGLVEGCVTDGA
jgi:hypothetical protein